MLWALIFAEQGDVIGGALGGALKGAIIGGVAGALVGLGMVVVRLFQKKPDDKQGPDSEPKHE